MLSNLPIIVHHCRKSKLKNRNMTSKQFFNPPYIAKLLPLDEATGEFIEGIQETSIMIKSSPPKCQNVDITVDEITNDFDWPEEGPDIQNHESRASKRKSVVSNCIKK